VSPRAARELARPALSRLALLPRRPFHVALAAFAGGLALAESSAELVLLVAAVVAGLPGALRAPRLAACAAALVLAGAAAGDSRLAAIDRVTERVRDGEHVALRAHLLGLPRPGAFGSSAEVGVVRGRLRGARLLVRAARWSPFPRSLSIGDELALSGSLRRLRPGTAPGSGASRDPPFDYDAYLRRRGVAAILLLDRVRATGRRRGGIAGLLDHIRERAQQAVVAGLPAERAALLRGMVLGEDERIDEATRDDWRDSGLAHLLAVSGQNVMLLAALALPLLMVARAGLRTRLIVMAVLIALYVPLAGAGPSLQRAGAMGLAGIAAMAASRPASRWYALILAATVTLLWNPRVWGDPGWQLSFAAVAGILTIGVPLQRLLRRAARELSPARREGLGSRAPMVGSSLARLRVPLLNALADGLAITVAATLATAPLLAHHFGYVALAGLPANLLALPAVAPAMWLGMLKIALAQLPSGALTSDAATGLGAVASLPVGYLAALAERFADMPGGRVEVPLSSSVAVIGAYAVLALLAIAVTGAARLDDRLPLWASAWRALPRARRRALVAAAAAATILTTSSVLSGPTAPDRITVRFLDVGQGDATLIQHPDGTAVLFDGGPPEGGVVRLLRRAGVDRLALVVATHASRDHHGGLPAVLRRFKVEALLDGGDNTADPSFRALEALADQRGTERIPARAPLTLTLAGGDLRIEILSPPARPPGPAPEDPNARAVVAIVSAEGFDLLLSADAESETLLPLDLPDVDAMKVPHHGSSDPGLPDLLERLRPEVAGIEVGLHNSYGHPAPATLAALRRAEVPTYRTDRDGTVAVTVDGPSMRIETER
jgi:competence protein ComEC